MTYRLTVTRLSAPEDAQPDVIERAVRDRLTPREGRAGVREVMTKIRHGASVRAMTRDDTAQPWQPVPPSQVDKLWTLPYDTWPACVTYRVRHLVHTGDGAQPVETRITLEPSATDPTGW
jgi:hypothetical protein